MINYLDNPDIREPEVEVIQPQDFLYKELRDKYPELNAVSKREYRNNPELQEQLTGARIDGSTWRDDIEFEEDMIIGEQEGYPNIDEKEEYYSPQENTQFAYGGDQTNSHTENRLTEFNGGGTHEENSLGGIPLGIGANGKRNSVEDGETRYNFDEGGYIFSNRIDTTGLFKDAVEARNQFALGGNEDDKKKKVRYGTKEYKEAYDKGEVINSKGVRSPIKLKEIFVKNNYKEDKNLMQEYADKIAYDNRDAGVIGATVGVPISAVTSFPQMMMTKMMSGKVQAPSEALNVKNPYGAFAIDAVADPANLVGAGLLSKESKISNLSKIKTKVDPSALAGLNSNGILSNMSVSNVINKKFIPTGKTKIPKKIKVVEVDDGIELVGDKKVVASIYLDKTKGYTKPKMISVRKEFQGNKAQDLLYDQAIRKIKKEGGLGLRSGDHLLSPAKTEKAHARFNYIDEGFEGLGGVRVKTLLDHKNPNLLEDWMNNYKKIPKEKIKMSLKDLVEEVYEKKAEVLLASAGIPVTAGAADAMLLPSLLSDYESKILKWDREKREKKRKEESDLYLKSLMNKNR